MAQSIGARIELQGEKEFKAAITNVTTATKAYKAELEKAKSAIDKNASAEEKASAKRKALTSAIEQQKQKVEQLKTAVEQAEAAGKTSENTLNRAKTALANATTELNRMESELADLPNRWETVGASITTVSEKVTKLGDTMTRKVTVPIVAAFAACTKGALDFEDGMAKVYTIADPAVVSIEDMSDAVLELSDNTGIAATELADGLYQALSASVDTGEAIEFLASASDLAKAGFLDTSSAVDVLTTIINAYGYEASDAQKIADQLVQTQNDGKTTVNELAAAMGQVIPTASALNIPLEQLNAAYAVMTKQGINTANSTTYLNGMFTELADGGSTVAGILQEKTGKSFGQLMADGYSLGDVLGILSESVGGNSEEFLNLWGNVRAGRGALSIVNGGIEEFNTEVGLMETASGNVSSALETLSTPAQNAREALNQLKNVGIEIGERFAPYIQKAAEFVKGLIEKWDALSPATQDNIIKIGAWVAAAGPFLSIVGRIGTGVGALTSTIGKVSAKISGAGGLTGVLGSLGGAFASVGTFITGTAIPAIGAVITAIAPALPIILGVAAAITGVILVVKNWGAISEWFSGVWESVTTAVGNAANAVKEGIVNAWNAIKTKTSETWNSIKTGISNAWNGIKTGVSSAAGFVKEKVTTAWDTLKSSTSTAWANIKAKVQENGGGIRGIIAGAVEGYKSIWTTGFNVIDSITGGKLSSALSTVRSKLDAIKSAFSDKLNAAKETVSNIIERIKNFFNFSWSLPHLKMPHLTITGGFSLVPPSVPHFSVEWYKRAYNQPMLFKSPTVLPTASGLKGFGDGRGGEVVMGQSMMYAMIRDAVAAGNTTNTWGDINVTVNGAETRNANDLADMIADRIAAKVQRRRACWA